MIMKKNSGYTLIELLVALVVLGILIAVGVPQMEIFFKGNRMVANANDLLAGLHLARSEAVKRNTRVTICKSTNADAATPACATGTGWDDGWFVFVESRDPVNVVGKYSSIDGAILKINTGAEGDEVTITASVASIDDYVSFNSRGEPKLSNGSSQSGVFRVCDDRGNDAGSVVARGVVLNASGRVRVTKDATKIGVGTCP